MTQNRDAAKILSMAIDAHQQNKHGEAMLLYQRVLDLDPSAAQAHTNIGSIYFSLGKTADAHRHFKTAYELTPDSADTMRGYALGLYAIGDKARAEKLFESVLQKQPEDLVAIEYRAKLFLESARMDQVLILLHPYYPDNWTQIEFLYYYCMALIGLQRHDDALALVRQVQQKHGDDVKYLRLLGAVMLYMSRYEDAVPIMRRTCELEPNEIGNWTNLCAACKGAYLFEEGIKAGEKALSFNPESFDALSNLGVLHREKGEADISLDYLRRALELRPVYNNVHYNIGLSLVAAGYVREGWPEAEWRWETDTNRHIRRPERKPQWRGQDIGRQHLLLYSDQGVGDTIQMARFFSAMRQRIPNAKITLRCEGKLIPLLKAHYGDFMAFVALTDMELGDTHSDLFDYHHPVVTLLATLGVDIDDIAPQAYLTPPAPIQYRDRPGQKVIGLSWHTRSVNTGFKRSLKLEEFSFLKDFGDIKIVDLQYGDTIAERAENAAGGFDIFHDDSVDAWADLQPFINQVAGCDLVISIDNSTVHVAGALGVPVWTIIPFIPYWRWTLHKEQTPWYGSMRFYQQSAPGKYDDVITRLKDDVRQWIDSDDTSKLRPATPFEPPVAPYHARVTQPVVAVLNAPGPLLPFEKQVSGRALIDLIKETDKHVIEVTGVEISSTPILPPTLVEFDTDVYSSRWYMHNPTLMDKIERADRIVINGENDIAGTSPLALKLLYLAYFAKKVLGKDVSVLNHSCFPEGNAELTDPQIVAYYRKVYLTCDDVAVIDPLSLNLLQQLKIPCRLSAPALPIMTVPQEQKENGIAVFIDGMTALKQAELLAEFAGLLNDRNETLILPYYHRHQEGRQTAEQIATLIQSVKIRPTAYQTLAQFYDILKSASSIVSNQVVTLALAQTISKKLLAIPTTLPDVEAFAAHNNIPFASPENIKQFKTLSTSPAQAGTDILPILPACF